MSVNIKTATTRYGTVSYFENDCYIGKSLELYGEYCQDEVELWRKLIKPGAAVIDAGANIGMHSIALAEIVGPAGHVYAIEAHPELCELVKLNTGDRVECINTALGDRPRLLAMCSVENFPIVTSMNAPNYGCFSFVRQEGLPQDHRIRVSPLDDLTFDRTIDFIKVDVEGFEIEVLKGAKKLIAKDRPLIFIEDDRFDKSDLLRQLIRNYDYVFYSFDAYLYSPENHNGCKENVFPDTVSYNLLCIPTEKQTEFKAVTQTLDPARSGRKMRTGWAGIVRLGGVGDNLIAGSVLRPLKAQGYKIDMICQSPQHVVFDNNPFVDKLSVKAPGDLPQAGMLEWQKWFRDRGKEYDIFVNLSHSNEGQLVYFPAMTAFWWPDHMRRKLADKSYLEMVHDIVGVPYDFGPLFHPKKDEIRGALETKQFVSENGKKKVIGWVMAGTRVDKVHPHFALIIARLIKELGCAVVMMGGPPPMKEFELCKEALEHVVRQNGTSDGLHHAASPSMDNETWGIRRICTFASVCDLVIGPDTGPMWSVAFEPVPKLLMHSHASVTNIAKHWINTVSLHADQSRVSCWPCHQLHDSIETCRPNKDNTGAACISDITVDKIVQTAKDLLT